MSHRYRDLAVWEKAMALAEEVYRATRGFPKEELYGLVSQVRRAAVSVPSNIAEGQGRLNPREFRQFLGLARGSLLELETQVELAKRLRFVTDEECLAILDRSQEVLKMLNALISKLEA